MLTSSLPGPRRSKTLILFPPLPLLIGLGRQRRMRSALIGSTHCTTTIQQVCSHDAYVYSRSTIKYTLPAVFSCLLHLHKPPLSDFPHGLLFRIDAHLNHYVIILYLAPSFFQKRGEQYWKRTKNSTKCHDVSPYRGGARAKEPAGWSARDILTPCQQVRTEAAEAVFHLTCCV